MRHRKVFFFVSVFLFIVAQFVGSPQRARHGERGSQAVPSVTAATKPAEAVTGIRIATCSRDSISFRVIAPDIRLDPVTVDGVRYERVSAEGAESFGETGAPDVPVFRWILAIPECRSIGVGVEVGGVAEYSNILVHPRGEERSLPFSEGGGVEVRFVRNDSIYRGSEEFPKDIARIRSIGYLRGQRLALLEFCPVRFHAKQQRLRVLKDVVLAVHYRDAEGEVIKNVGPMQSALAHAAINYDVAGGPSAVQGAGSPRMTGGSGQVCWCEGSDYEAVAASASACGADYLIIVTDSLVANAPQRALVDSLADHRKNTNGFNVAIACVSQLTDPPDTLDTPVQIRNLIKAVYDDSSAAHMGDGRLGYVLLLGDAFDPERNVLIPSYYGWADTLWWDYGAAADGYYSLLDSDPNTDRFPDVFLGRLPVDDDPQNWELRNVVSNILAYEPLPTDANWPDKILMVSGGDLMYFTFQSELTFANFFDYIDANYIPGDKQVRKMHVIEALKEGVVSSDSAFSASVVDTLRKGYWAFGLFDHGNYFYLRGWNPGGCFLPIHYDTLGAPALPFVVAIGSHLGEFDFARDKQWKQNAPIGVAPCCPTLSNACGTEQYDPMVDSCDVMCERLVVQPDGAIGAFGYSRTQWASFAQNDFVNFFRALFQENAATLGDVLLGMKLLQASSDFTVRNLTLFGDPALNIRWQDVAHDSVDVAIRRSDITSVNETSYLNTNGSNAIRLTVRNLGRNGASQVTAELWNGHPDSVSSEIIGTEVLPLVPAFGSATDTIAFSGSELSTGTNELFVVLDPDGELNEPTVENNVGSRVFDALPYETGFPVKLDGYPHHCVVLADVAPIHTGSEILFSTDAALYCYASDGTGSIWRFSRGVSRKSGPVIGNLYEDGVPYVVYEAGGRAYVLAASNGAPRDSFVVDTGTRIHGGQTYALHDVVPGDQEQEIVTFRRYDVAVYRADGTLTWSTPIASFPDPLFGEGSIAIGDIDANGIQEVLVARQDTLKVLDVVNKQESWPSKAYGDMFGARSIVLLDRDADAQMEVLVCSRQETEEDVVTLYDSGDSTLWSYTLEKGNEARWAYVAAADLDGDGSVEIAVLSYAMIRILSSGGTLIYSRETEEDRMIAPPLLADIQGDEGIEIITLGESESPEWYYYPGVSPRYARVIRIYDRQLNPIGTPYTVHGDLDFNTLDGWNAVGTPAVGDADGDGETEMAFASSDSVLHLVQIGTKAGMSPWPQRYKNAMNTNVLEQPLMGTYSGPIALFNTVRAVGDVVFDSTAYVDATVEMRVSDVDASGGGVDAARVEIWANDALKILGTEGDPVRIIGWDGAAESLDSLAWWGIFVADGASAGVNHCEIRGARHGISIRSDASIENTVIEHCALIGMSIAGDSVNVDSVYAKNVTIRDIPGFEATNGIGVNLLGKGAALRLEDCTVEQSDWGVLAYTDAKLYTERTTVQDHTIWGVGVYNGGTAEMESTTVQGNSYIGLMAYSGAEVTATRCTFTTNGWGACVVQQGGAHPSATFSLCNFDENDEGLRVQSTSNVVVDTSQFTDQTAEGVYCLGGADIEITRSTFDDNLVGIKCDASSPEITSNTIQYNTGGIGSDNCANPIVRRNKIKYNATGIVCLNDGIADLDPCCPSCGGVCPDSCLDEANSILYSTGFHVSNLNSDTLDAECTYWGKKVLASKFYGLVDYTPYLTQDPLAAPAWQGEGTVTLPVAYALSQNYPNPFNPVTTIRYSIPPPSGRVSIRIYNVRGERVRTLVDETVSAGSYTIPWEGEDNRGQKVASGVYFVRMVARDFRSTKKLLVLK